MALGFRAVELRCSPEKSRLRQWIASQALSCKISAQSPHFTAPRPDIALHCLPLVEIF